MKKRFTISGKGGNIFDPANNEPHPQAICDPALQDRNDGPAVGRFPVNCWFRR
jgi:hypothetical protein